MQVAYLWFRFGDDFTIHLQNQPQHAVGGGVRGAHVENEFFPQHVGGGSVDAGLSFSQRIVSFEFLSAESHSFIR